MTFVDRHAALGMMYQALTETRDTSRYLLVDFFNTSCLPCRKSIPYLQGFVAKYPQLSLSLFAFKEDKKEEEIKAWLGKIGVAAPSEIPTISPADIQKYRILVAPTLFIIDRQTHKIILVKEGWNENKVLEQNMEQLLKK
jgi:thiol-disulfide isomerase/thioredoxin